MATILITGANRGIGLELTRQLRQRGDIVIAACREPTGELKETGAEVITGIDVTDETSLRNLAAAMQGRRLDVLVNNAGILSMESLDDLDLDRIRRQFEVNALGPLRTTRALLPTLARGSKVIVITSRMGSIGDNTSGSHYGYRMSKAAVNMAAMSLAQDLKDRGIAVAVLHPGMVATRMTARRGVPPAQSAAGLIRRVDALNLDTTGGFWHAEGERLPW